MLPSSKTFPTEQQLIQLARVTHFPASVPEILRTAEHARCSPATIQLLRYFSSYVRFENGVDFMNQCIELELFIREVSDAPRELLRTP